MLSFLFFPLVNSEDACEVVILAFLGALTRNDSSLDEQDSGPRIRGTMLLFVHLARPATLTVGL